MVADSSDLCEVENYQENTNTNSNDNAFPVSTNGKFNNYGCCTSEIAKEYDCWTIFQPDYAFPVSANETFNNYGCCAPKIAKEYNCRSRFQKEDGNSSMVVQDKDFSKSSVKLRCVSGRNDAGGIMTVLEIPNHTKMPRFNTWFSKCKQVLWKLHWEEAALAFRLEDWLHDTIGIIQESTCVHTVQKHSGFGRLQLFDNTEGNKKPTIHIKSSKLHMFNIKDLLKNLCAASKASKEVPAISSARQSKDTSEFIGNARGLLGEVQNEIHIHVYMVPARMSKISSYSIWPHRNIRTGPLVEAGFSCKDPNTPTVECKSCGLELNASNLNGMNPMQYHRENSPDCEFFQQTNSERPRGQQNRPLTDSSPNPGVPPVGVNQEAAARSLVQQPPGNNQKKQSTQANVSYAQTHSGNSNGNICIDEATSPNSHRQAANASPLFFNSRGASLDLLTADERPRTGEASDRTVSTVQNNNNLSSSGEEVRENENMIGALGGENPHQIRNPRYTEQKTRRESFAHWPHRARHDIEGLVNAGFFYTGAEDIVRCFFCDIGLAEWNPDDDPWVEHARHSPECPYLRDQKGQDYINNFQTQCARIYTPKHPQYTQMDARRRSYVNTSWPRDNVLQTPELLAAAGFFYMGDGDKVRCHYCDGGLREWEPEDDPWVEHARWFPFCKFLLKIKGIDFIQSTAIKNKTVAPPAAQRYNADPLVERRRTDNISPLTVPNNERTTGREVVRQNNNATVGAHGGDIPYLIRNPRYIEQNARCQTYLYWTHQAKPDINCLVNAGFFYTGDRDIVRCFSCDIERAEWNPDDDPWVEHARHSPECPYLRDQRGQDYINNIQEQCARPDNGFQEPVASPTVPQNNAHYIPRTGSTLPWDEDEDEMDLGDGL